MRTLAHSTTPGQRSRQDFLTAAGSHSSEHQEAIENEASQDCDNFHKEDGGCSAESLFNLSGRLPEERSLYDQDT